MPHRRKKQATLICAAFILILFFFTRLYRISEVPRGIHVDEAGMALDALCLATRGTERFGLRWPVYLYNFGGGQSALYAYLAAAAIRLTHFSLTVCRLPAVLGGFLVLVFGSLILRRTMGVKAALFGGLMITIFPYFLMASRWGFDCNLMLGFITMSLWLLMQAVSTGKKRWFALSGLSFGITLYSYAISFAVLPMFLFAALIYLLLTRKVRLPQIFTFAVPLAILATPLLLFVAFNSGLAEPFQTPFFSIPLLAEYRGGELTPANILENLNLFYLLLFRDELIFNMFPKFGTFYYPALPFLAIGLIRALADGKRAFKERQYRDEALILLLFLVMVFTGLIMEGPNVNRMNAIFFTLIYFVVRGVFFVCRRFSHRLLAAVTAMFCVCFLFFGRYYYTVYPQEIYPQPFFNDTFIPILDYIEESLPAENVDNRDIYVDNYEDNIIYPYVYTLLRRFDYYDLWFTEHSWDHSYGPYHFNLPDEVDETGIYIMYANDFAMAQLENSGFQCVSYGLWKIYWK